MKDHRKERAEARKKAEKLVSQMTLLEKASQLKYDAAPVKRLGVPAYNYWNEALHGVARAGVATMFPQAIAMAAVFDDEEMKKVGDIIATEGRAKYNAYSAKEASSSPPPILCMELHRPRQLHWICQDFQPGAAY